MRRMLLMACLVALGLPFHPSEVLAQHDAARQLTADPWLDGYAEWSPDGTFVVYTSQREGQEGLFRVAATGGGPERFCSYRAHHARFSPDGRYVAFDGEGGTMVMMMSSTGGVPVRVVPSSIEIESSAFPTWAADGRRLVFRSGHTLQAIDLPTGDIKHVYDAGDRHPIPIYWTRDGGSILAALLRREPRSVDLWWIPLDGAQGRQVTTFDDVLKATVSPDERWIVFQSRRAGSDDLWVMPFAGGEPARLTAEDTHEREPRWSRDGRWIAYTSTRGGPPDVFVMAVDAQSIERALGTRQ